MAKKETALAIATENYPALVADNLADIAKTLREMNVGPFDMPALKVPGSGGEMWAYDTIDGKQAAPELDVIILSAQATLRGYWHGDPDKIGLGSPPDCQSYDGVTGYGVQSEDGTGDTVEAGCMECPLEKFGSAIKGDGAACGQFGRLFLLTEHSAIPLVLKVPQMSLKPMKKYAMALLGMGRNMQNVATTIGLFPTKNTAQQPYSQITFASAGPLSAEQVERVAAARDALMGAIKTEERRDPGPTADGIRAS